MIPMEIKPPSRSCHYGPMIFPKMSTYCDEERNGFEFVRWNYMNRKDAAKIKRYESGEQGEGYQRFSEARVESMSQQRKRRVQCSDLLARSKSRRADCPYYLNVA
ncbi:hypothetical protein WUBG_11826 [Wuchereria bancrofti]|uniref:Uncharacterized protein n=2 Tax=Wuchereria bancrofti TaxID=6293 RepID=J9EPP7_WUCBA|nr:hypothetical protein WUBG_11826 [Wuchereria bancrofti]VDM19243.1 unnamed protein product [Wuchereria bancrofti]